MSSKSRGLPQCNGVNNDSHPKTERQFNIHRMLISRVDLRFLIEGVGLGGKSVGRENLWVPGEEILTKISEIMAYDCILTNNIIIL